MNYKVLQLYNPGILEAKLPDRVFRNMKNVVNDPSTRKGQSMTSDLVGVIREEYIAPEILGLRECINSMYAEWKLIFGVEDNHEYKIDPIWINYMKKGEFNPNHCHPEAKAVFVIWVTIPYNIEEEMRMGGYNNKMHPSKASCFEITYNTMSGGSCQAPFFVNKQMEGTILMFPGSMVHCVYPFYTSNEERISIAGNIYLV